MFKKKPKLKQLSSIRSSDRRRLADEIISDLKLSVPSVSEDSLVEEKAEACARLASVRNSILPENTQCARFTTTIGPELKQVSGTVYIGTYDGGDERILWVKVADQLWPTVYTLWRNAQLVPLLHTQNAVIDRIQAGADLMVPGLARGPPFPVRAQKGRLVAIAGVDSPSVPLAVGYCEIDVSALQQVRGSKGVAVRIVSWKGDEAWNWSATGKRGIEPPEVIDVWLHEDGKMEQINVSLEDAKIHHDDCSGQQASAEAAKVAEMADVSDSAEAADVAERAEEDAKHWSAKEIDDAFFQALLYGIDAARRSGDGPHYGLSFPLKPAYIVSNMIQPYLPIFTTADADALQIKKTTWKNMKKFIRYISKISPPFCSIKEQAGETIITSLDFEHAQIQDFQCYSLPKRDKKTQENDVKAAEALRSDAAVGQSLKVVALYEAKEKISTMFANAGEATKYHTAKEVKDAVTNYCEREHLIMPHNKRLVKLNALISNEIMNSTQDQATLIRNVIPRDVLGDRVLSTCSAHHMIFRNTTNMDSSNEVKAGPTPKITITTQKRTGNKTVTKVSGFEPFYITAQPLADELRRICAGSTSIDHLTGTSSKNPLMEVMVQGPHPEAVTAALERRGIDRKWIEYVDKTNKKKKI